MKILGNIANIIVPTPNKSTMAYQMGVIHFAQYIEQSEQNNKL
jgi:hypothetical protein